MSAVAGTKPKPKPKPMPMTQSKFQFSKLINLFIVRTKFNGRM